MLGSDSNMCLSCHDGTVAVGSTVAYGQVSMQGSMNTPDVFGSKMQTSHPFSLVTPLKDNIDLVASLAANGTTADPTDAVHLIKGSVECTSCHNPHIQAKDLVSQNFLVKDSSSGQLCLSCHDPSRTASGQVNPLADWATSSARHVGQQDFRRGPAWAATPPWPWMPASPATRPITQRRPRACCAARTNRPASACHNGSSNVRHGDQYTNVFAEYASPKVGHPFPTSTNPHDAAENTLLNNNRHATCVDCHSGHGSQPVQVFPAAPADPGIAEERGGHQRQRWNQRDDPGREPV